MNNAQFRRLLADSTPTDSNGTPGATPRGNVSDTLGSRMRSSIPMTPRSVAGSSGIDFARQVREQHASLAPAAARKFKSRAAPRGTKLASGYQDRTQLRTSTEEDDKAARIKSLEEMVKLGQMDQESFEKVRDEVIGGDVKSAHLVKGLDWKLLERARKGEDLLAELDKPEEKEGDRVEKVEEENKVYIDEELDQLEEKEIQPLAKEEKSKKGTMAAPSSVPKKRTRDEILRELKASRLQAEEERKKALAPSLGSKFKKIGAKQSQSRIEIDNRGREILVTVDEEGRVKRKVKRVKIEEELPKDNGLLMPDKDAKPLGMEIPENKKPAPPLEEDDIDIFDGVGDDYDPLGDEDGDDDSDSGSNSGSHSEEGAISEDKPPVLDAPLISPLDSPTGSSLKPQSAMLPPPLPLSKSSTASAPRNYFKDLPSLKDSAATLSANPLKDPTILAALKKASTINLPPSSSSTLTSEQAEAEAAKLARRKAMLQNVDRDADDMDLGFGSSRFEDEEDGEDREVKLSVWGGKNNGDGEEGEGGKGGAKEKRKRGGGGKKRKGDGESAKDVLGVLERRKKENEGK
ncbi:MAG: hypothetical protein MMC33_001359 [Icmadophila ericetorum]|nr:hypothetical protein [Icmadophila ericetorum]